ncbi:DUF4230 domain-containing protein [Spirochaeta africana]|uniref:DUF4230 domain-containing protein n=1 Tax=Spirochaeta africana (strain ATCC 700263 / DSM 8902 / Z-7692) TaxID=889378 RepID=H9UMB8_SPIAZ|nr:DUF4230 domain-containing protein [Spirochaeta africana]AFG38661.1 hypothetical protein Spiaf_2635 [Spirochaeta africana DSM 8902]
MDTGAKRRKILIWLLAAVILLGSGAVLLQQQMRSRATAAALPQLEQRIRAVLQLHTAEHLYRDVIYVGEQTRTLGFATRDQHLLFAIQLRVRAGIDLDDSSLLLAPGRAGEIQVTLPPARILSVQADEHSIHEYFSGGRGTPITMLSYFEEIAAAKDLAAADARQRGILQQAYRNAQEIISNILELDGTARVVFTGEDNA